MSFRTIMGSIGNAFKTGFQNGNLAKGMMTLGATASAVGMTGMMIRGMNNSNNGGCCGGGSIFNNYFNNPYCGMGMMGMGYNNMYGMNSMNTYMGNMMAYQYGQQVVQQIAAQSGMGVGATTPTTATLTDEQIEAHKPNHTNAAAGAIPSTVVPDIIIDSGIENFVSPGATAEDIDMEVKFDKTDKTAYINKVTELSQGFIKQITGGSDTIDLSKFKEYMQDKYGTHYSNATDAQKAQYDLQFENLFVQMDLNGDGDIDWKEMASSLMTMDAGGTGPTTKVDGKITQANFKDALQASLSGNFGHSNVLNYTTLFGSTTTT